MRAIKDFTMAVNYLIFVNKIMQCHKNTPKIAKFELEEELLVYDAQNL